MLVLMALLTTAMTEPLLRWWLPKELLPENAANSSPTPAAANLTARS
jgi:hypothetical protein